MIACFGWYGEILQYADAIDRLGWRIEGGNLVTSVCECLYVMVCVCACACTGDGMGGRGVGGDRGREVFCIFVRDCMSIWMKGSCHLFIYFVCKGLLKYTFLFVCESACSCVRVRLHRCMYLS